MKIAHTGISLGLALTLTVGAAWAQVAPVGGSTIGPGASGPTPATTPVEQTRRALEGWFAGFEFVPTAKHFARLGPTASPALLELAGDASAHLLVRARAVSAMAYMEDPRTVAWVAALLEDPEAPSVLRRKAALVLAERQGPGAIEPLVQALLNAGDDVPLREACARGLRGLGDASWAVRDALLRDETHPTVRGLLLRDTRIGMD